MERVNSQTNKSDPPCEKPFSEDNCDFHQKKDCSTSEQSQENVDNDNVDIIDDVFTNTLKLVTSNYIIMKKIMQHLNWRDISTLSSMYELWDEVAKNIHKSNLDPQPFSLIHRETEKCMSYKIEKEPKTAPMLILAFLGKKAASRFFPSICYFGFEDACFQKYKMLDYLHRTLSGCSNTLIGLTCDEIIYPGIKSGHGKTSNLLGVVGLYLPQVPGVKVHKLRQQISTSPEEEDLISEEVSTLMKTEYIKGVLIFASCDEHNPVIEDVINMIKLRQGSEQPFAVGGCMVEGTQFDNFNEAPDDEFINLIVITTQKATCENPINFDVFSKIIALKDDSNKKILTNISQMSKQIPKREHSIAVKLSCVGRTNSHRFEQTAFNSCFPHTKTVGCFGMGEIGVDCLPGQDSSEENKPPTRRLSKMRRIEKRQSQTLFYEYSSVMVVFSWGNLK